MAEEQQVPWDLNETPSSFSGGCGVWTISLRHDGWFGFCVFFVYIMCLVCRGVIYEAMGTCGCSRVTSWTWCMMEMIGVMRTRRMMMVGKWWWWWLWWCLRISVETAHHKKTQMPLNPRTWKSGRKLPQIDLLWNRNLRLRDYGFPTLADSPELADWISPNDVAHYSIPFFFPREVGSFQTSQIPRCWTSGIRKISRSESANHTWPHL